LLAERVKARPDILIINRFGYREAIGGGLLGVLAEALELNIPTLIAVPRALFSHWLALSNGLAVKLDCRRGEIHRWWHSVSPRLPFTRGESTFCELYK